MAWHSCTDHSHTVLLAFSIASKELPREVLSSKTSGDRFCLTCFLSYIPSMLHIELLTNVKLLTEMLGQFFVPRNDADALHSPFREFFVQLQNHFFSVTGPLLEVVGALVRRACGLSRDKPIAALVTCLKRLIVDFATLLTTLQESAPASRLRPSFEVSKVTILGMSSNEELSLNASEQYFEEGSQHHASKGALSHLAGVLVRLLQNMFSKVESAGVYHCLLLLSDVYESCAALRVASCDYVVDFLGMYTTEVLVRQSSRTLEVYLYLLHLLFMESRQRPDLLENLSNSLLSLSSSRSPSQLPVFISSFCATIENHSEAQVTIRNALSLMYFVVSLETTSEVVFGDPNDPAFALAAESTLYHVVPLIIHRNTEVGLLACETVRLLVKGRSAFSLSEPTREWIMDLALEGVQLASKPSAVSLIGLLNALCDGCDVCSGGNDTGVGLGPTAGANPNALVFIIQLAGLADDAFQDALNGRFLEQYFKRNATNVDAYAEQILHACQERPSFPFQSIVRLLYLLSGMAADVAAIRPEVSSLLVQYFLRQLEADLASSVGPPFPADCKAMKFGTTLEAYFTQGDRPIWGLLGRGASFLELLRVVCYFLSDSVEVEERELLSLAVQLLAELWGGNCSEGLFSHMAGPQEGAEVLGMVCRLLRGYTAAKAAAAGVPCWWCSRFHQLLEAGLLDWLLRISVGQEDESVERQRGCLFQCVLGDDKWVITEDMTRGAASCKELLLRDASSHRISNLLASLAALGCPAPMDKDGMDTLLAGEFSGLVQLLVDQQAEFSDAVGQSQLNLEVAEDATAIQPGLSVVMDALSSVLQVSAAYYKYFGCIPKDLPLNSVAEASGSSDCDESYAFIVHSSFLRREIRQLIARLDGETCTLQLPSKSCSEYDQCAMDPSDGQLLEALLRSPQFGKLALHILLALFLTDFPYVSVGCAEGMAHWHRWLGAAAAPDAGNTLFEALFRCIREFHRGDPAKQVGLLRLLNSWVRSLNAYEATPLLVCLFERYIIPYLLIDRSQRDPLRGAVEGGDLTVLLIDTISPLPPTQSSAYDGVVFKWSVHTLIAGWTTLHCLHGEASPGISAGDLAASRAKRPLPLNTMVLLHLLLERAHGREMVRRYGESLLPVLLNIQDTAMRQGMASGGVTGFHGATVALMCGLLKNRLQADSVHALDSKRISGAGSPALTTEAVRGCWICLPILHCHELIRHECKEYQNDEKRTVLLLRLKAQVVSAFQFIFLVHTSRVGDGAKEVGCARDRVCCSDDEYHTALCLVNWCMELVLARDTVWAEPSCDVIHVLFEHYRATLATSQEALALYLCSLKCGLTMLPASELGMLLSALLYVGPHLPWCSSGDVVHELVRHFLTTVDPTALSSGLAGSQLPREGVQAEEGLPRADSVGAGAKVYKSLSNACRYYARAVPQASPLSLHRLADFLAVPPCDVEEPSPARLFVQNRESINLFTEYIPL